eukprot:scaffold257525_cov51-Prasinocladus_malaysianus.AAC.1
MRVFVRSLTESEGWQGAPSVPQQLPSADSPVVRLQAGPGALLVLHVHHDAAAHALGVHLRHGDVVQVPAVHVQLAAVANYARTQSLKNNKKK